MIRILIAGISTKKDRVLLPASSKGMTLIEVAVVVAIISVILLLVFPKIPLLSDYTLKRDARKLAALFRSLDESATTKKTYYKVSISPNSKKLETRRVLVESSKDGLKFETEESPLLKSLTLNERVIIEDIEVAGLGVIREGDHLSLFFNPVYGAEPFKLHIKEGETSFTINYNPYSGKVRIIEGRI